VLSKKPAIFKNFTGLEVAEFDALTSKKQEKYNAYEQKRLARQRRTRHTPTTNTKKYNAYEQKRLAREDRKRGIGAGHPFKLSLTDRLLMLLMYYHLYPSSTLLGYLIDLGQTNVLKDIRNL
jgi:hypothetical protein